jgi:hypothetical protein
MLVSLGGIIGPLPLPGGGGGGRSSGVDGSGERGRFVPRLVLSCGGGGHVGVWIRREGGVIVEPCMSFKVDSMRELWFFLSRGGSSS